MFCYICEVLLLAERVAPFKAVYGEDAPWVRLFRRDPGYVATELRRDVDSPRRFITIDYWTTREACMAFRARVRDEFEAIDAACGAYMEHERYVGKFEPVD